MAGPQKAKYRVGIIGGGRMGTHHARAYALNLMTKVVAVADQDPENLELFCHRFNVPGYGSYEDMFANEQIDIAAPVLPVRANADAVVAAAQAGVKAVFCEKPLTGSLEDADRMVESCHARGILFAAGLIPRNYPEYWEAREIIESGEIGEVQSINIYDKNDQGGCHGINLARMFARDADVDWVVGWVEGDPFSDYEAGHSDSTEGFKGIGGYIRFCNGLECFSHVRAGVRSRVSESGRGLEVVCSRGVLFNDSRGLHLLKEMEAAEPGKLGELKEVKGLFEDTRNPGERPYDAEGWRLPTPGMMASVQALVNALENGTMPKLSTGDDLRKALELCIAMRESHRQNHCPVELPLADRSLKMYPVNARWNYKKEVYGREQYMAEMARYTRT
jgi:predicted dehydrogenase